jgi:ribosomal protein S18 acetylase RimI-like enzyme
MAPVELVERRPTVEEYRRLIAAVGWKPRDPAAIARALDGSIFAFCAEAAGALVGMGRIIGDGGLHYYLTDIVVDPAHQRRGIGARLVRALTERMEGVPYANTWVGLFAVEGTADFYARLGYKAQRPTGPAMYRWLNPPPA